MGGPVRPILPQKCGTVRTNSRGITVIVRNNTTTTNNNNNDNNNNNNNNNNNANNADNFTWFTFYSSSSSSLVIDDNDNGRPHPCQLAVRRPRADCDRAGVVADIFAQLPEEQQQESQGQEPAAAATDDNVFGRWRSGLIATRSCYGVRTPTWQRNGLAFGHAKVFVVGVFVVCGIVVVVLVVVAVSECVQQRTHITRRW